MNEPGMVAMYECVAGCGEPVPAPGVMCAQCEVYNDHYELQFEQARRGVRPRSHESAHLGAVEREPHRRRVFTFLGWNQRGAGRPARLDAESAAAPVCADPVRRSELMARLPRVHAGVQTFAIERSHLWSSDVSLAMVAAIVLWDAARTVWYAATDALCLLAVRHLRTRRRLQAFAFGAGLLLAAAVSCAAWRLR